MTIRPKLLCIVTEYDKRRQNRKDYNRYALGHYMAAVATVMEALESGEPIEKALTRGFCGSLLRHIAKKLGLTVKYDRWQ
jgi:hypothetical protein